jgi:hypothetical protein
LNNEIIFTNDNDSPQNKFSEDKIFSTESKSKENSIENNFELNTPKLELNFFYNSNFEIRENKITVTPNSLGNIRKKTGKNFIFGKKDESGKNDFGFNDSSIEVKQFEILFDKSKDILIKPDIGKFFILDCKSGIGTFIKLNKRFPIENETIISFCNVHMLITPNKSCKLITKPSKSNAKIELYTRTI